MGEEKKLPYYLEQRRHAEWLKKNNPDMDEKNYVLCIEKKEYSHFFKETSSNLFEFIRKDAKEYFKVKGIEWHANKELEKKRPGYTPGKDPEGDMLSSQISCLNHLFFLRKYENYPLEKLGVWATEILKNIDKRIISAEIVRDGYGDDGYIEFESWGTKNNNNPLQEKSPNRRRGKKSTSIDAIMIGKKEDGNNILVLIEWKYTEECKKWEYENGIPIRQACYYIYNNGNEHNRFGDFRICNYRNCNNGNNCNYNADDKNEYHTYHNYFTDDECPIKLDANFKKTFIYFYYEPLYQLMRQTLWGWKAMKEFNCDEYIHLHVIPEDNKAFREINSDNLNGNILPAIWKNFLKDDSRYKVFTPEELLSPLQNDQDLKKLLFSCLKERYLEEYN